MLMLEESCCFYTYPFVIVIFLDYFSRTTAFEVICLRHVFKMLLLQKLKKL